MGYFKRVIAWLLFFAGLIALLYIASGIFMPKSNLERVIFFMLKKTNS